MSMRVEFRNFVITAVIFSWKLSNRDKDALVLLAVIGVGDMIHRDEWDIFRVRSCEQTTQMPLIK